MDDLLTEIAAFIKAHSLSESAFGLLAVNDKHLVADMRKRNRELRRKTEARVRQYMAEHQPEAKAA